MEDREVRKQKLQEEKDEIVRKIQVLAGQIIKDNGGHDIKFRLADKVDKIAQIDKAISTVAPENNYNSYDDIYEVTKSQLISWGQALRTARNLLNSKEP